MHLYYQNVNDAFTSICRGFADGRFNTKVDIGSCIPADHTYHPPISRGPSRYGQVIRIEEPVTITYTEPLQRVLFHPVRDANPFFHLIEALWMLAGQNSVKPLAHLAKRMSEFSDDDLTEADIPYRGSTRKYSDLTPGVMWGAYGYRWRNWFHKDQLEQCIHILRSDQTTRRVVLDMWCPDDLTRVESDPHCKDIPCNLVVMFSPRASQDTHRLHVGQNPSPKKERRLQTTKQDTAEMVDVDSNTDDGMAGCILLDMTVVNRSNDTLWGALGSNYVHFSFLMEYVANAVGMGVGYYHQISNNLHVYSDQSLAPGATTPERWSGKWLPDDLCQSSANTYQSQKYNHYPLYRAPFNDFDEIDIPRRSFDNACLSLFNDISHITNPSYQPPIVQTYFRDIVYPMLRAWQLHKARSYEDAFFYCGQIVPMDWRVACEQWLRRRSTNYTKARDNGIHAATAR